MENNVTESSNSSGQIYQNPLELIQDHWLAFAIFFIAFLGSIASVFYCTSSIGVKHQLTKGEKSYFQLMQWVKNRREQQYRVAIDSQSQETEGLQMDRFISDDKETKILDDNSERLFSRKISSDRITTV
jgi:hypothetical protein